MKGYKLSKSQMKIIEVLSSTPLTYEDIARRTGLSYDGVRGRVAELASMGIGIKRQRQGLNTVVTRVKDSVSHRRMTTPIRYSDVIAERLKSIEDFENIADFLYELREDMHIEPPKLTYDEQDETAVLLLSDLHFGEVIKDFRGNIIFNSEIAEKRMKYLFENVIKILKKEDMYTLRIMMLGDIIDGDMIYKNHMFFVEKPAIQQTKDAVRVISECINMVVNSGIVIRVDAVRGNHGITNYKNLEEDNWDNVVYDMLELVFATNEDVEFNHYPADQVSVPVVDRTFVITHGVRMGNQIKTAAGLKTFRGLCGIHKLKESDIVCVGHLHEFGVESDQGKYLIRNGSLPDASEFALKLNYYSEPEQTLLIIKENKPYPIIIPIEVKE